MQQIDNNAIPRSSQPDAGYASLFAYLQVMVKRRKLIVAGTMLTAAATAGYSLTLPNIYTAKAKILPPQQSSGLLSAAMMQGALAAVTGGDLLGESKTAKLYVEMLKVESLRDPIIDRFKLQQVYDKKFRDDVYKALNANISVTAGKEGIITIAVDDADPKRAAEMANSMVEELKKLTTSMSMTGAGKTKGFLVERMAKAKEEMIQAEESLKQFQTKYKTLDASQQATLAASATAQLAAQLTGQELQLSVLRRTYADTSQTVKATQQSIAVLKDKIARMQAGGGTAALPGFEQIPERGQEYLHLMRRFKTAEAVCEMLAKQYEVSKLNAENDVSSIQVIQQALVPERKSRPARAKITLMSVFAGFFCVLLLALTLESCAGMPSEQKERWKNLLRRR